MTTSCLIQPTPQWRKAWNFSTGNSHQYLIRQTGTERAIYHRNLLKTRNILLFPETDYPFSSRHSKSILRLTEKIEHH